MQHSYTTDKSINVLNLNNVLQSFQSSFFHIFKAVLQTLTDPISAAFWIFCVTVSILALSIPVLCRFCLSPWGIDPRAPTSTGMTSVL